MWKVLGAGLLLLAGQAFGSEAVGCKARLQAVNDQLVFAKAHNNAGQIVGLEQAARNIKAHCTDEGLLKEQKERVNKLRGEVDERLLELAGGESQWQTGEDCQAAGQAGGVPDPDAGGPV